MVNSGKDLKYGLYPCRGIKNLGIPRGHLYLIKKEGEEIRFMTKEDAREKYGRGNILTYDEGSLCPVCSKIGSLEINLCILKP